MRVVFFDAASAGLLRAHVLIPSLLHAHWNRSHAVADEEFEWKNVHAFLPPRLPSDLLTACGFSWYTRRYRKCDLRIYTDRM